MEILKILNSLPAIIVVLGTINGIIGYFVWLALDKKISEKYVTIKKFEDDEKSLKESLKTQQELVSKLQEKSADFISEKRLDEKLGGLIEVFNEKLSGLKTGLDDIKKMVDYLVEAKMCNKN
jgi:predicted RNase H-like nuclease (RuvC/YqgF family)